jgi:hypothetical protein
VQVNTFSRISGLNNRVNPNPRGLWTKEPILILNENVIFNVHLMIIKSVTHVFIKQILRAAEQEPPPLPHRTVQGVWVVVRALFILKSRLWLLWF